ncbi:MAG: PAS domain S-box protein [Thermoleophilia bacterium]
MRQTAHPRGSRLDATEPLRALARSEKLLASSEELARLGSWTLDLSSGDEELSDGLWAILGVPPGSLPATFATAVSLVHDDDLPRLNAALEQLAAGTGPFDVEYRIVRPDGEERVLRSIARVVDEDGHPVVLGAVQDVTEVARERDELQRTRAVYQAIAEHGRDLVAIVDLDGRVAYASPSHLRTIGYEGDELVGRPALDVILPADRPAVEASLAAAQRDGESDLPVRLLARDGRVVELEVRLAALRNADGEPWGVVAQGRDVTERNRTERERMAAEALFRFAFDGTAIGFLVTDQRGTVVEANDAALALLGRPRGEVIGLGAGRFTHPEDVHGSRTAFDALRGGGKDALELEERYVRPDGSVVRVRVYAARVRTAEGEPRIALQVIDVTESHRALETIATAKARLERTTARLEAMVAAAPVGIYELDGESRVQRWNPAAERILGWTAAQLLGRSFRPLVPEELWEEHVAMRDRAFAGETFRGETVRVRPDGSLAEVEYAAAPVVEADGRVETSLGIVSDIGARKQAERELRDSLNRLALLVETSPAGIYEADAEGRCVYVNQRWCDLTGTTREEVMGDGWAALLHPDDRERAYASWRGAVERRSPYTDEYRFVARDGRVIWANVRAEPLLDDDGRVTGWLGVAQDVTEQHLRAEAEAAFEARLQQTQKLESLAVLAGGLAHDFNNLLVGVLGNVGLALEDLPEASPVREHVEEIETAARRAAELTRQLLAYAGKGRFVLDIVDPNELLRATGRLLETAVGRDVDVLVQLGEDVPHVEGDRTQLQQVAIDLVINASEAIGAAHGAVVVSTAGVDLDAARIARSVLPDAAPGRFAAIRVTDTGPGIPDDVLPRVFEPFFTTRELGRGLGLAAVQGIARSHGGTIEVDTAPGLGTTVSVYLPALD